MEVGKVIRLDFTYEAYKGCRDKPSVKLVSAIMDSNPGDIIEIKGEDTVFPFSILLETLEDEGFTYEIIERDDLLGYYEVRAVKQSGGN